MKNMIMSSAILLLLSACASKEPKKEVKYKKEVPQITTTSPKPGPDTTSLMMASELGTDLVTEIKFAEGSSELGQKAKNKLNKLWEKALKKGEVTKVEFITWADKEYPAEKKEDLNDQQKALADSRNEALRKFFIRKDSDMELVSVSMAERPGFMGRVTASDEVQAKKSLQLADIATTSNKSGVTNASKSIIMIFYSE